MLTLMLTVLTRAGEGKEVMDSPELARKVPHAAQVEKLVDLVWF